MNPEPQMPDDGGDLGFVILMAAVITVIIIALLALTHACTMILLQKGILPI